MSSRYKTSTIQTLAGVRSGPPTTEGPSGMSNDKSSSMQDSPPVLPLFDEDIWQQLTQVNKAYAPYEKIMLLIDASESMLPWHDFLDDLRYTANVIKMRQGIELLIRDLPMNDADQERLKDDMSPQGTGLLLIVSDCVSKSWHDGYINTMLAQWGKEHLVTILQILPMRLWKRTALKSAIRAYVGSSDPITNNANLRLCLQDWLIDSDTMQNPIPVLPLEKDALLQWIRVIRGRDRDDIQGRSRDSISVYIFEQPATSKQQEYALAFDERQKQRLSDFRGSACLDARILTGLFAATPITLPIVRHLRKTILLEQFGPSDAGIIAEALLGELIKRLPMPAKQKSINPDTVQYDFFENIRSVLLDSLPLADSLQVLQTVYDFLEEQLGHCPDIDIEALRTNMLPASIRPLASDWHPFIAVASQVVSRLGSTYQEMARRLKQLAEDERQEYLPYKTKVRRYHQDSIVKSLHNLFDTLNNNQPRIIIVQGPDGADKQHIAAKYARYYGDRYTATFWIRASACDVLFTDVSDAAESLKLPMDPSNPASIVSRFKEELEKWTGRFLLVISGLEENGTLKSRENASNNSSIDTLIKDALPEKGRGDILLLRAYNPSTTDQFCDTQENIHTMDLSKIEIDIEEEMQFLLEGSGQLKQQRAKEHLPALNESARSICDLLKKQPYSIALARAYIRTTGYGIEAYNTLLQQAYIGLADYHWSDQYAVVRETLAAYLVTMRYLELHDPLAAAIIKLCVFFHREIIYQDLLQYALAQLPPELLPDASGSLSQSLELLTSLSLLYRASKEKTYRVRPVIRKAQQTYMERRGEDQQPWAMCAVNSVAALFPSIGTKEWKHYQQYIPHAEECLKILQNGRESQFIKDNEKDIEKVIKILQMFTQAGEYLNQSAQYDQAGPFFEYAKEMSEGFFGAYSLQNAICLGNLGEWHCLQGHFSEAQKYLDRGFGIYITFKHSNDAVGVSFLLKRAIAHSRVGNLSKMTELYNKFEDVQKSYSDEHSSASSIEFSARIKAVAKNNEAEMFFRIRKVREAGECLKEAMRIYTQELNIEDLDSAMASYNLGRVYQDISENKEAEKYFKEALKVRQKILKDRQPFHPDIAKSFYSLGFICYSQRKYVRARAYFLQALEIYKKAFGSDYPYTLSCDKYLDEINNALPQCKDVNVPDEQEREEDQDHLSSEEARKAKLPAAFSPKHIDNYIPFLEHSNSIMT